MKFKQNERDYIKWQNHAFHFYLGSRLLMLNDIRVPAAFSSQQTLELMIKATLLYHDKSFQPHVVSHSFNKMLKILKNKVRNSENVNIPKYFYFENRFQSVTRYPSKGKGVLLPGEMLDDLDKSFFDLLVLVPFQFNSLLVNTFDGKNGYRKREFEILERKNTQIHKIKKYLKATGYLNTI